MSERFTIFQFTPDICTRYEGASTSNFILSVLITMGIVLSYLPQYKRIYNKKTSEGLSTQFLLLGSCSSIFTATNIILVTSAARDCCRGGYISTFNCINSQMNLIQIGLQSICAIMILVCVLVITRDSIKQDKQEYENNARVGKIVLAHAITSIVEILIAFLSDNHSVLLIIANLNGLMSTLLTVIKYVPQIWTTYNLKHPGTLSIGMMCIQTPGGALFTATLFFAKGSHWSSWISYFVAFILQGTLLSMCFYYEYFRHDGLDAETLERRQVERIIEQNMHDPVPVDDNSRESSPLLPN